MWVILCFLMLGSRDLCLIEMKMRTFARSLKADSTANSMTALSVGSSTRFLRLGWRRNRTARVSKQWSLVCTTSLCHTLLVLLAWGV
jgi:hypothetical protein